MSMQGWIKIHRQILDHWMAQEAEALATWLRILLEANHETHRKMFNGSLVEIKRGQLIFGLNAFSKASGVSIRKLRRYLKIFEAENMIDRLTTSRYSLITVLSYDQHQSNGKPRANRGHAISDINVGKTKNSGTKTASQGQAESLDSSLLQENNEHQTASQGQTEGKQRVSQRQHLKNVKNDKNVKNAEQKRSPRFVPPTLLEIYEHMKSKGVDDMRYAEKFFNHYESNGWKVGKNKMQKWKSSVSNWLMDYKPANAPELPNVRELDL